MERNGPLAMLLLCLVVRASAQLVSLSERLGDEGALGDSLECTISVKAVQNELSNDDDPQIEGSASCDGVTIYDETRPLSELEPVELAAGISLFAEHEDKGYAYLVVTGDKFLTCTDCYFEGLPAFPAAKGGSAAAIIVNSPSHTTFKNLTLYLLKGGYKLVGGMYLGGKSLALISASVFQECHGGNAGVFEVDEFASLTIVQSLFERNTGEVFAGSVLVRARGGVKITRSQIHGVPAPEEFVNYVLGDKEALPEDLTIVNAGAIAVIENAELDLMFSGVYNCWGLSGAIHTTHGADINLIFSRLENNTGLSGGGIFVEGERGHNAQMHDTKIVTNTAREGGGLVVLGEGNMYVNQTEIRGNIARIGGGFYSDFSAPGEEEYVSCGKQTEGSTMSFDVVQFLDNIAETSGGGIHAKCSLVRMRNMTIAGNTAGDFGGGIFVDTVADLDFEYAPFDENKAGQGGSAIYAIGSTLVDLEDCEFTNNEVKSIEYGGTVMIDGTEDVVMKRVHMESNTAGGSGAALWLKGAQTLSLENIYLSTNRADDSGGAIYGAGVSETVDFLDVTIVDNSAAMHGGGVIITDAGDVSLSNVVATGNSAGLDGGGINFHGTGDFEAVDTVVEDNEARNDCGGLAAGGFASVKMTDTSVSKNSATANGGGVCFKGIGSLTVDESVQVDSNTADEEGGGIYMDGATGPVSMSKTSIEGNSAAIGVAASLNNCTDVTLTDMSFKDNNASFSCGAIQASGVGILLIENVEFSGNSALEENGGAICLEDIDLIAFTGTTSFKENAAMGTGGAVYVAKSSSFDTGSTGFYENQGMNGGAIGGSDVIEFSSIGGNYSENSCEGSGGGIYLDPVGSFSLEDVVFMSNRANDGGAVRIADGSSVDVKRSTFEMNTASRDGGGIMADHFAKMGLEDVIIANNTAKDNGAGLASGEINSLRMLNAEFEHNRALSGKGGAFHLAETNVDGDDIRLHNNEAYHSGGAFLCEGDSSVSIKNMNFSNNFARAGQSLSAYCGCSVNVSDSVFHREKHRKHNGDFFERKKSCGAEIVHANCLFFGSPDKKIARWILAVIILVGILLLFCIVVGVGLTYYRKKYGKEKLKDEEDPKDRAGPSSEEYSTTYSESDESDLDEDEAPHEAENTETKQRETPQDSNKANGLSE